MSPTTTRKSPTFVTDDMRHKIAGEYRRARKMEKAGICTRYNISGSAICNWITQGYGDATPPAAAVAPADRPLDELLWAVVIAAREAGSVTLAEAKRLLELVR